MKKLFVSFFATLSLITALALPVALPQAAAAQTPEESVCIGTGGVWDKKGKTCSKPGNSRTVMGTIRQITTLLLFLVSAIAVLMVIVGGFKYVVSQGDQAAITSAKNTILYSLIGLVVAIASFAIIEFIFNALNVK